MIQTQWVVQRLHQRWPELDIAIETIHTTGDRVTQKSLTQIGGDGVFVIEIERALQEGRIDLAVHSLKDMPTLQPDGLHLIVTGPREDVRDVLIYKSTLPTQNLLSLLNNTNEPLRIGTSSLRRTAQIRALCPQDAHVQLLPIRGNVDTRLRKLDTGDYDAIVLAAAGLHRLRLHEQLADRLLYIPNEQLLPAPGQGALGLEIRDEPSMLNLLAPLQDTDVQAATTAERMFMRRLGAGCYLPVAAYGEHTNGILSLSGLVLSEDGQTRVRVQKQIAWSEQSTFNDAEQLGMQLADEALARGASSIVNTVVRDIRQGREFVESNKPLEAVSEQEHLHV